MSDNLANRLSVQKEGPADLNHDDSSLVCFLMTVPTEMQRNPELAEVLTPIRDRAAEFIAGLVRDAVANDEFVEGVAPRSVEDLLIAVMSGLAVLATLSGDQQRHLAAVKALRRFMAGDLVRRGEPTTP